MDVCQGRILGMDSNLDEEKAQKTKCYTIFCIEGLLQPKADKQKSDWQNGNESELDQKQVVGRKEKKGKSGNNTVANLLERRRFGMDERGEAG